MRKYSADLVIAHLKEKWGEDAKCPMCRASDWKVPVDAFALNQLDEDENTSVRHGYAPLAPVTCGNCGFVAHVHLMVVYGELPGTKAESDKEKLRG